MRFFLLSPLLVLLLLYTGCRDRQRDCQQFAKKYADCILASYQQAKQVQNKLSPAEIRRGQPLLKRLGQQLQSGKIEERYYKLCLKRPPGADVWQCVLTSRCEELRKCRTTKTSH